MQKVYLGVLAGVVPAKVLATARGLLDFIYYAQYQSHMAKTLNQMQHALDEFHTNKDAFIDLGICKHFNIPKLHSMIHYISSIQNFGSIDGLNLEGLEQLHIDYMKKGYHASNKNNYTVQMVKWLQRQEVINLCTAYLHWCNDLAPCDDEVVGEDREDHPEGTLQETDMLDVPAPVTTHSADHVTVDTNTDDSVVYRVSKSPAFSSIPLTRLERAYGASQFLPTLKLFLQNLPGHTLQPNEFDRYNIYNAVYVTLPSKLHVSDCKRQNAIHATAERDNGPRRPPSYARFDTALIIEDENLH